MMPGHHVTAQKPYAKVPHFIFHGRDGMEYNLPTAGDSWSCTFPDDTLIALSLYPENELRTQNFLFTASMIGRKRDFSTGEYKGKAPHEISPEGDSPALLDGMHSMYAREDTTAMFLDEAAEIYESDPNMIKSLKPLIQEVIGYMIMKLDDYGIPWMEEPCALPRVDMKDSGFFGEYEGTPEKYSLLMWIGGISRALRKIAPVAKDIGFKDPYDEKTLTELHKKTQKAMHEHFREDSQFAIAIGNGKHITGIASDFLEALQYFDDLTEGERRIARKYAEMLSNPFGFANYAREQKGYHPFGYQSGNNWPVMNGIIMKGAEMHGLHDIYHHSREGLRRIDVHWPGIHPEYVIVAKREDIPKETIEERGMQSLNGHVFERAGSDQQLFSEAAIRRAKLLR